MSLKNVKEPYGNPIGLFWQTEYVRYPSAEYVLEDKEMSVFLHSNLIYNIDVGAGIREEDRLNNQENPIIVKLDLKNL